MNKQEQLAEQIAKKYKLLITNEESLYRRNVLAALVEAMGVQQESEEAQKIVEDLAAWSKKYPRGMIYSASNQHMDKELISLEERAKAWQAPAKAVEASKSDDLINNKNNK
jgi:hypothetical protein